MGGSESQVKKQTAKSKLKEILEDGQYHRRGDLIREIGLKNHTVLNYFLHQNRKELAEDEMILCELVNRTIGYRKVKVYNSMS